MRAGGPNRARTTVGLITGTSAGGKLTETMKFAREMAGSNQAESDSYGCAVVPPPMSDATLTWPPLSSVTMFDSQ